MDMTKDAIEIDISSSPDLTRLAEEVEQSGVARVLVRDGVEIAVVSPVRTEPVNAPQRRSPRRDPRRALNIVGAGASGQASDIARHKDEYIANAIDRRRG
jgi:6-phosphogluconate dehydrogenase (decarboxylating)